MPVLLAAKYDPDEAQVLIDTKDRGGLRYIKSVVHNILHSASQSYRFP